MALALVALISAGCGGGLASSRRPAKPDPAAGIARHLQVLAGGRDVWEAKRCTGLSPTARGGAAAATRRPAVWNVEAKVAEVADGVEKVRGLTFEHRVKPEFLRNQDIAYRFADPLRGGVATPYFEVDERLLSTLGAMFSGVDLQRLSGRAVAGGLEGLYEPADRHLMVRRRGKLGPQERFVLSHELTHALDDQRIGIDLSAPRDADASLALSAAVEGDATLVMNRYAARFLEPGGQAAAFRAADPKTDSPLVSEIPHYVYARGRFPYAAGFRFMCRVYLRDGRAGLDRALREPPSTTAQVLFPERYARREAPATPAPTGSLPSPWRLAAARTFGAADLLWLYEAPAGDARRALPHPLRLAAGWDGGALKLWVKGKANALSISLEQHAGAPSLCKSLVRWYRASFPRSRSSKREAGEALASRGRLQAAVVTRSGRSVKLGIAPTLTASREAVGEG